MCILVSCGVLANAQRVKEKGVRTNGCATAQQIHERTRRYCTECGGQSADRVGDIGAQSCPSFFFWPPVHGVMASSGVALQILSIDRKSNKTHVNAASLKVLDANLRAAGAVKVVIIAVMGVYRGGKSFIMDLLLRFLRWEDSLQGRAPHGELECSRASGIAYATPSWLAYGGAVLEGGL